MNTFQKVFYALVLLAIGFAGGRMTHTAQPVQASIVHDEAGNPLTPEQFKTLMALQEKANAENQELYRHQLADEAVQDEALRQAYAKALAKQMKKDDPWGLLHHKQHTILADTYKGIPQQI